ncbi:large conductance mechanosensitive channel protein MscL [Cohnella faecalis]|uniref:Large-conductance mechanosensitive channel n=2 Tax=Cohnella faecalis TaxID=2315694 RepID=A0A398CHH6_9BACL|nr:large conductance mechanosensitive channel protein MscL [Cohnella faecalis]RIE02213.1 large conductance mechanosensitive channel protein MscL [Cohnella faecalis]
MFKSFFGEFKTFAMRGNVVDLAVGVIIGGAFGKIVTSLVNDIVMPPIGRLLGGVDFTDLFINLNPEKLTKAKEVPKTLIQAQEAGAAVIAYGQFINVMLDFIIVAFCVFMLVKLLNKLSRKKEAAEEAAPAAPTTKECPYCISEIPIAATRCGHCTSELNASPARG